MHGCDPVRTHIITLDRVREWSAWNAWNAWNACTDIITYDLDKALLGGVGAKLHSKHPHAVLREKIGC